MRVMERIGAAAAIVASIAGAGFTSGREIVVFFGQFGVMGYVGALMAAALIGYAAYRLIWLSAEYSATDMSTLSRRVLGGERGCGVLMAALVLAISAAMLAAGGELSALLMDIHGARQLGIMITALVAAVCAARGLGVMSALGSMTVLAVGAYYAVLSITQPEWTLTGYEPGALPSAVAYAGFNMAAACGVTGAAGIRLRESNDAKAQAASIGRVTGLIMLCLVLLAVLCVRGHWDISESAALPSVLIAAKLGPAGYYVTIAVMWMAVVSTLAGGLFTLEMQSAGMGVSRAWARVIVLSVAITVSCAGFEALVNTLYPILGGVCAIYMAVIIWRGTRKNRENA